MHISDFAELRHNWNYSQVKALFELPFNDLIFYAQSVHRQFHNPNYVQLSTLMSIKTGACPEDCKYCSQSGHYNTALEKEKLIAVEKVIKEAKAAKEKGASRFCMGAAWRSPSKKDMPYVLQMVKEVKALGLETCMTLGMLDDQQAAALAEAGLDYYNHNLDTSPEHYHSIVTTRSFQERIDTLHRVKEAGVKVCAGGILGMGETSKDRAGLLIALANLPKHPDSVPINMLVPIPGTPLESVDRIDDFEFIRTVAVARLMMPASVIRLSAGREGMNDQLQSLCFMAGANSIFYGNQLLTTTNNEADKDQRLFERLGINTQKDNKDHVERALDQHEESSTDTLFYDAMA